MASKQYSPEQAAAKLRKIDVLVGEGKSIHQACKEAGITDVTYYRWRKEYGGLKVDQAKKCSRRPQTDHPWADCTLTSICRVAEVVNRRSA